MLNSNTTSGLFVSEYQLPRTQRDVVVTRKAENTCVTTMDYLLTSCLRSPSRVSWQHVIRVTKEGGWDERDAIHASCLIWADSSPFTIRLFITVCRITSVADTALYNVTVRIVALDKDHTGNIFVHFLQSICCLCLLCCSIYCLCVNVYCTAVTGYQPSCS
jgi:hypothetical protein